jgi:quercetin dioxygenase-like cupin family protein
MLTSITPSLDPEIATSGPDGSRWDVIYSLDAIEVGYWELQGEQSEGPHTASDELAVELIVVLEGELRLESVNEAYLLTQGDALIISCPIPSLTFRSPGMKCVYIVCSRGSDSATH